MVVLKDSRGGACSRVSDPCGVDTLSLHTCGGLQISRSPGGVSSLKLPNSKHYILLSLDGANDYVESL